MSDLALSDGVLHYRTYGAGDKLVVLLHGWPQTGRCWAEVAPALADAFTVVVPDLRGYGQSRCFGTDFSKRAAARDLDELVRHLGHDTAAVVGHDRGARVAHRWALDRPERITQLALLDVLPTREVVHRLDERSSKFLWHWFLHLQPGLAETLIGGNTDAYLRYFFEHQVYAADAISPDAVGEYVAAFSDPQVLHTTLEDYRASFAEDLALDDADDQAGNRVRSPLLLLWGAKGGLASADPVGIWSRYADDVRGLAVDECKHFLPEEQPAAVATHLLDFLS